MHLNKLQYLWIEKNRIGGRVPQWFMDTTKESLLSLNFSSNSLLSFEQPLLIHPWTNLLVLDLRGNKFRGLLPIPSNTIQVYDISNNHIYGAIPEQICVANTLSFLDLSNNSMSGHIPRCIAHQLGSTLQALNLCGNTFHGTIPQNFSISCSLMMINLSDNQLEGKLPPSLANCTMLQVLDLGKNRVSDTFPFWLGKLNALQVLVLRHNCFHGKIRDDPESSQAFKRLRIIDLSYNFFVGALPPRYIQSWRAMKVTSEDHPSSSKSTFVISYRQVEMKTYYSSNYVITITNKGSETLYRKILTVFRVVDFSSNNFTGKIPSFVGNLRGLQALNLSNNNLEGIIPSSLSNIKDLQSLDLSRNKLSGMIPEEISKLTFLEVFNVSHNRLVGPIPKGPQFNTFDNTSYDGNLRLCGYPLSKNCGRVPPSQGIPSQNGIDGDNEEEDSDMIAWIIRAFGCASGFIIGFVIGKLYITDKYHAWFIRTFEMKRKWKTTGKNASNQRRK